MYRELTSFSAVDGPQSSLRFPEQLIALPIAVILNHQIDYGLQFLIGLQSSLNSIRRKFLSGAFLLADIMAFALHIPTTIG